MKCFAEGHTLEGVVFASHDNVSVSGTGKYLIKVTMTVVIRVLTSNTCQLLLCQPTSVVFCSCSGFQSSREVYA